eukprot:jgi/Chrpa1/20215/Chrysochromulina_OHIO_Genome00005645-RA
MHAVYRYYDYCQKMDCCPFGFASRQWTLGGGQYHDALPWRRISTGTWRHRTITPRLENESHSYVALFRSPSLRLASGFAHMRESPTCCWDWGFTPIVRLDKKQRTDLYGRTYKFNLALSNMSLATYAALPGALSCQAKMLLGTPCHRPRAPLTSQEIAQAVATVEALRFVGLQEHWQRSVCLWHARFGAPLARIELLNSRRGTTSAPTTAPGLKGVEEEESGASDPQHGALADVEAIPGARDGARDVHLSAQHGALVTTLADVEAIPAEEPRARRQLAERRPEHHGLESAERHPEHRGLESVERRPEHRGLESAGDVVDEADEAVYSAAKRRFWRDVEAHSEAVGSCMRAIAERTGGDDTSAMVTPLHGKHCLRDASGSQRMWCYRY